MIKGKRNNYRFWHSPLALGIIFCAILFFGYKLIDLTKKEIDTRQQKNFTWDEKNNLEKRKTSILEQISKLDSDEGKEGILREKFPVVKEGEKMVIIVDEEVNDEVSLKEGKTGHGFWNWVKEIFNN